MTTQKNINDQIKTIINKGIPFSKEDLDFLMQVIKHHPSKNKLDDIENILINRSGDGLLIQYSDSTLDSISYKKCVRGMLSDKLQPQRKNIREAFRNEIYVKQILPFRKQNNMLGKGVEYHVGHGNGDFSFDSIVKRFCKKNCLEEENINIEKRKVQQHYECTGYFLADKFLANKWKSFHKQSSKLIMQTAEDNLRQIK